MKQLSLRRVLNLSVILGLAAAAAILSLSFWDLSTRIDTQFRREAEERAHLVARLMLNALLLSDYQEVQSTAENLLEHRQVVGVKVTNAHGESIVDLKPERAHSKEYVTVLPIRNDGNGTTMGTLQIEQSYDFFAHLLVMRFVGILLSIFTLGAGLLVIYIWASRTVVSFFLQVSDRFQLLMRDQSSTMKTEWRFRELSELCSKFNELSGEMLALRKTEREQAKFVALAELASQVAHDIRSPATAICVISTTTSGLSGMERNVLRGAAERINGIAEELLERRRSWTSPQVGRDLTAVNLLPVLTDLIDEKHFEFRGRPGVRVQLQAKDGLNRLFCWADPEQLKRIFSNLINNGLEAMNWNGAIVIELSQHEGVASINFRDEGRGIPSEVLPRLLQRGQTFGKKGGTGLGLAMSNESIKAYGGSLEISSEVGVGTTVTVRIPTCLPPAWFVSELVVPVGSEVVILDDDSAIHDLWRAKFGSIKGKPNFQSYCFFTETEMAAWLQDKANPMAPRTFLVDYELTAYGTTTGLEVIKRLRLTENAILVTGRYSDPAIVENCERLGVRLLPKPVLSVLPVRVL